MSDLTKHIIADSLYPSSQSCHVLTPCQLVFLHPIASHASFEPWIPALLKGTSNLTRLVVFLGTPVHPGP